LIWRSRRGGQSAGRFRRFGDFLEVLECLELLEILADARDVGLELRVFKGLDDKRAKKNGRSARR
jgi:hypothetical protein